MTTVRTTREPAKKKAAKTAAATPAVAAKTAAPQKAAKAITAKTVTATPGTAKAPKQFCPTCGAVLKGDPILTERQDAILRMVGLGMNRTQIAAELGISPRTVEFHREHLQDKLRLRSKSELIIYAVKNGFA